MKTKIALAQITLVAAALLAGPTLALAEPRLPDIPPEARDAAQKKAVDDYLAARKVPLTTGPFMPMMYSPEALSAVRGTGDYFRFKSSLGPALTEFVAVLVAREWSTDYEWSAHEQDAGKYGIGPAMIAQIAAGARPDGMTPDQALCYDYVTELFHNKQVSDATFAKAEARFGKKGVVDMTGVVGYYVMIAMQLNVAQTPPLPGGHKLPRFP